MQSYWIALSSKDNDPNALLNALDPNAVSDSRRTSEAMNNMRTFMLFVSVSLLRASTFWVLDYVNDTCPPFTLSAIGLAMASCVLLAVHLVVKYFVLNTQAEIIALRRVKFDRKTSLQIALFGFLMIVVPSFLFSLALNLVGVDVAATIFATAPLLAQLVLCLVGQTDLKHGRWIGLVFGLLGICIITAETIWAAQPKVRWSALTGTLMMLIGTLSIATASVFAQRSLKRIPSVIFTFGYVLSAAIITIIMALLEIAFPPDGFNSFDFLTSLNSEDIIGLLYMGMVAYPVIAFIDFRLIQTVGAVRQLLIYFLVPLFGVIYNVISEPIFNSLWDIIAPIVGAVFAVIGLGLAMRDSEQAEEAGMMEYSSSQDELGQAERLARRYEDGLTSGMLQPDQDGGEYDNFTRRENERSFRL